MTTSRRVFLVRICQAAVAPAIPGLVGCGTDNVNVPDIDAAGALCSSIAPTIGANHGHTIVVPVLDVEIGQAKTFTLTSNGTHSHSLRVGAADMMTIANGGSVTLESSVNAAHSHTVTLSCVLRDAGPGDASTDASDSGTQDASDSGTQDAGDSGTQDAGDGAVACNTVNATIGSNHPPPENHTVTVPAADVMTGTQQIYTLSMNSTHSHTITVTSAMFAMLATGSTVMVTSSDVIPSGSTFSHMHVVTLVCA